MSGEPRTGALEQRSSQTDFVPRGDYRPEVTIIMKANMKLTRLLSVLIPLAGVQACADNGKVDLGTSVTGASLADYVDAWEGYTEAQQFVPGSDRIRVKITGDGQGTLVLGESHTYPPATDPNVGYPPNEDTMGIIVKESMFRPGMEYPLHGVKVESKRIRFTVSTTDFYKAWCELQTPVATNDPNVFYCGPNGYSGTPEGVCTSADTGATIDCGKAALCTGPRVCVCTATACTSNTDFMTQFDGALREDGTLLEGTFNNATVRLERQ